MRLRTILLGGTLLAAVASATDRDFSVKRFLQADPSSEVIQFNAKLPCYPCIMGGFIYCMDGTDHQHVATGDFNPDGVCCTGRDSCPEMKTAGWTCSSSYADQLLSLRMCPFRHDRCGAQSEFVFKNVDSSLNQDLTFYPGDVCFFTLRTECGSPGFTPQGDALASVEIYTIEFDDADVDSYDIPIGDTGSTVKMPKKTEAFKGKTASGLESQLVYSDTNTNGSVTYYYANGTFQTIESPKIKTYFDDLIRDYTILYPNQTNVTYNIDGSYEVQTFNAAGSSISTYFPGTSGARRRNLQDVTTEDMTTWGLVIFFSDGRIKEILPSGAIYWSYKYYSPKQNPNRDNATQMNSTWHLRVRYNVNGSYIMYEKDAAGDTTTTTKDQVDDIWKTDFKTNIGTYVEPPFVTEANAAGSLVTFYNDTQRQVYDDPADRLLWAVAPAFDDIYPNGTVIRVFWNGTIANFYDDGDTERFVKYVKAPTYLFEEEAYHLYPSDDATYPGRLWVQYTNNTERFFQVQTLENSRYENVTSVKYEEHFFAARNYYRVVFNNGTIALYYYVSKHVYTVADGGAAAKPRPTLSNPDIIKGDLTSFWKYERAPFGFANDYVQVTSTDGSFTRVYETVFNAVSSLWETKTRQYQPALKLANSSYDNQTALIYTEVSDDLGAGLEIRQFNDGWFAVFDQDTNELAATEEWQRIPAGSLNAINGTRPTYLKVTNTTLDDGTYQEFYATNDTSFFYPPQPDPATDSDFKIAIATSYYIQFRNTSIKSFYNNGTIAWFTKDKKFVKYDIAPLSFAVDYPRVTYADGSYNVDFTSINQTKRFVQSQPLEFPYNGRPKNTSFEIATSLLYRDTFSNGTSRGVYRNGSIAIFQYNGFSNVLVRWEVEPKSFFVACTDSASKPLIGGWWRNCTNGTRFQFGPDVSTLTNQYDLATSFIFDDVFTNGTRRRVFRNGTIAIFASNGVSINFQSYIVKPSGYFDVCNLQAVANDDGTKWLNCSQALTWNATLYYKNLTLTAGSTRAQRVEFYTGPAFEVYTPDGTLKRTFRNNTVAKYKFNGMFYSFISFDVAPASLYVDCEVSDFVFQGLEVDNPDIASFNPLSEDTLTATSTATLDGVDPNPAPFDVVDIPEVPLACPALADVTDFLSEDAACWPAYFPELVWPATKYDIIFDIVSELPLRVRQYSQCIRAIQEQEIPTTLNYIAVRIPDTNPIEYNCYYEIDQTVNAVYNGALDEKSAYIGKVAVAYDKQDALTRCMQYSIDGGCPQFCAGNGYWKELGDDSLSFSDSLTLKAHCFVDENNNHNSFCSCEQVVDAVDCVLGLLDVLPEDDHCQYLMTVATDASDDGYAILDEAANAGTPFAAATCIDCINEIYTQQIATNGKFICIPDDITTPTEYTIMYGVADVFDETITPDLFEGYVQAYLEQFDNQVDCRKASESMTDLSFKEGCAYLCLENDAFINQLGLDSLNADSDPTSTFALCYTDTDVDTNFCMCGQSATLVTGDDITMISGLTTPNDIYNGLPFFAGARYSLLVDQIALNRVMIQVLNADTTPFIVDDHTSCVQKIFDELYPTTGVYTIEEDNAGAFTCHYQEAAAHDANLQIYQFQGLLGLFRIDIDDVTEAPGCTNAVEHQHKSSCAYKCTTGTLVGDIELLDFETGSSDYPLISDSTMTQGMCITQDDNVQCVCGQKTNTICRLINGRYSPNDAACQYQYLIDDITAGDDSTTFKSYSPLLNADNTLTEVSTCQKCAEEIYKRRLIQTLDYFCQVKAGATGANAPYNCLYRPLNGVNDIFDQKDTVDTFTGGLILAKRTIDLDLCHETSDTDNAFRKGCPFFCLLKGFTYDDILDVDNGVSTYESFTDPTILSAYCYKDLNQEVGYCACVQSVNAITDPCAAVDGDGNPTDSLCPWTQLAVTEDILAQGNYDMLLDINDEPLYATSCHGCISLLIDNEISFTGNYMCMHTEPINQFSCLYETAYTDADSVEVLAVLAVGADASTYSGRLVAKQDFAYSETATDCVNTDFAVNAYYSSCAFSCNAQGFFVDHGTYSASYTDITAASATCYNFLGGVGCACSQPVDAIIDYETIECENRDINGFPTSDNCPFKKLIKQVPKSTSTSSFVLLRSAGVAVEYDVCIKCASKIHTMLDATGKYLCEYNFNSKYNCFYEKKTAGTVVQPTTDIQGYNLKLKMPFTSNNLTDCVLNNIEGADYKKGCAKMCYDANNAVYQNTYAPAEDLNAYFAPVHGDNQRAVCFIDEQKQVQCACTAQVILDHDCVETNAAGLYTNPHCILNQMGERVDKTTQVYISAGLADTCLECPALLQAVTGVIPDIEYLCNINVADNQVDCLYSVSASIEPISSLEVSDFNGYVFNSLNDGVSLSSASCMANGFLTATNAATYTGSCAYQCSQLADPMMKGATDPTLDLQSSAYDGVGICYKLDGGAGDDTFACSCAQTVKPNCGDNSLGLLPPIAFDKQEFCRNERLAPLQDPLEILVGEAENQVTVPLAANFKLLKHYDTEAKAFTNANVQVSSCSECAQLIYNYRVPLVQDATALQYMCIIDTSVVLSLKFNCQYHTYDPALELSKLQLDNYYNNYNGVLLLKKVAMPLSTCVKNTYDPLVPESNNFRQGCQYYCQNSQNIWLGKGDATNEIASDTDSTLTKAVCYKQETTEYCGCTQEVNSIADPCDSDSSAPDCPYSQQTVTINFNPDAHFVKFTTSTNYANTCQGCVQLLLDLNPADILLADPPTMYCFKQLESQFDCMVNTLLAGTDISTLVKADFDVLEVYTSITLGTPQNCMAQDYPVVSTSCSNQCNLRGFSNGPVNSYSSNLNEALSFCYNDEISDKLCACVDSISWASESVTGVECDNVDSVTGLPKSPACAYNQLIPTDTVQSMTKQYLNLKVGLTANNLVVDDCFQCAEGLFTHVSATPTNTLKATGKWMCQADELGFICLYEKDPNLGTSALLYSALSGKLAEMIIPFDITTVYSDAQLATCRKTTFADSSYLDSCAYMCQAVGMTNAGVSLTSGTFSNISDTQALCYSDSTSYLKCACTQKVTVDPKCAIAPSPSRMCSYDKIPTYLNMNFPDDSVALGHFVKLPKTAKTCQACIAQIDNSTLPDVDDLNFAYFCKDIVINTLKRFECYAKIGPDSYVDTISSGDFIGHQVLAFLPVKDNNNDGEIDMIDCQNDNILESSGCQIQCQREGYDDITGAALSVSATLPSSYKEYHATCVTLETVFTTLADNTKVFPAVCACVRKVDVVCMLATTDQNEDGGLFPYSEYDLNNKCRYSLAPPVVDRITNTNLYWVELLDASDATFVGATCLACAQEIYLRRLPSTGSITCADSDTDYKCYYETDITKRFDPTLFWTGYAVKYVGINQAIDEIAFTETPSDCLITNPSHANYAVSCQYKCENEYFVVKGYGLNIRLADAPATFDKTIDVSSTCLRSYVAGFDETYCVCSINTVDPPTYDCTVGDEGNCPLPYQVLTINQETAEFVGPIYKLMTQIDDTNFPVYATTCQACLQIFIDRDIKVEDITVMDATKYLCEKATLLDGNHPDIYVADSVVAQDLVYFKCYIDIRDYDSNAANQAVNTDLSTYAGQLVSSKHSSNSATCMRPDTFSDTTYQQSCDFQCSKFGYIDSTHFYEGTPDQLDADGIDIIMIGTNAAIASQTAAAAAQVGICAHEVSSYSCFCAQEALAVAVDDTAVQCANTLYFTPDVALWETQYVSKNPGCGDCNADTYKCFVEEMQAGGNYDFSASTFVAARDFFGNEQYVPSCVQCPSLLWQFDDTTDIYTGVYTCQFLFDYMYACLFEKLNSAAASAVTIGLGSLDGYHILEQITLFAPGSSLESCTDIYTDNNCASFCASKGIYQSYGYQDSFFSDFEAPKAACFIGEYDSVQCACVQPVSFLTACQSFDNKLGYISSDCTDGFERAVIEQHYANYLPVFTTPGGATPFTTTSCSMCVDEIMRQKIPSDLHYTCKNEMVDDGTDTSTLVVLETSFLCSYGHDSSISVYNPLTTKGDYVGYYIPFVAGGSPLLDESNFSNIDNCLFDIGAQVSTDIDVGCSFFCQNEVFTTASSSDFTVALTGSDADAADKRAVCFERTTTSEISCMCVQKIYSYSSIHLRGDLSPVLKPTTTDLTYLLTQTAPSTSATVTLNPYTALNAMAVSVVQSYSSCQSCEDETKVTSATIDRQYVCSPVFSSFTCSYLTVSGTKSASFVGYYPIGTPVDILASHCNIIDGTNANYEDSCAYQCMFVQGISDGRGDFSKEGWSNPLDITSMCTAHSSGLYNTCNCYQKIRTPMSTTCYGVNSPVTTAGTGANCYNAKMPIASVTDLSANNFIQMKNADLSVTRVSSCVQCLIQVYLRDLPVDTRYICAEDKVNFGGSLGVNNYVCYYKAITGTGTQYRNKYIEITGYTGIVLGARKALASAAECKAAPTTFTSSNEVILKKTCRYSCYNQGFFVEANNAAVCYLQDSVSMCGCQNAANPIATPAILTTFIETVGPAMVSDSYAFVRISLNTGSTMTRDQCADAIVTTTSNSKYIYDWEYLYEPTTKQCFGKKYTGASDRAAGSRNSITDSWSIDTKTTTSPAYTALTFSSTATGGCKSTSDTAFSCAYQCLSHKTTPTFKGVGVTYASPLGYVDATTTRAHCVQYFDTYASTTTLYMCACEQKINLYSGAARLLQAVDNAIAIVPPSGYIFKQQIKYKSCTNGTNQIQYQPRVATDSLRSQSVAINYEELFTNGTRTRYYTNGTVAYLKFDLSIDTMIVAPTSYYSEFKTFTKFDMIFASYFSVNKNHDDKSLYESINIFDNGKITWFLINTLTAAQIAAPTPAQALKLASFVKYYETDGTNYGTRTNYYYNGTVAIENVTATLTGINWSYTKVNIKTLVSPTNLFVPYTVAVVPSLASDADLTGYTGRTFAQPTYTVGTGVTAKVFAANTTTNYYAPNPRDLEDEIPGVKVGEVKSIRLATDPYYFSVPSGTTLTRNITFRNGTIATFTYNTTLTKYILKAWQVASTTTTAAAPQYFYQYVWMNVSYVSNKTDISGNWYLDNTLSYTQEGYELKAMNGTVYRYMPELNVNDFVGGIDSFDYKKTWATTYKYYEQASTGSLKVTYRNGTIATFSAGPPSPKTFTGYIVAPTSYFMWHIKNTYADGSQEIVFSNYTTLMIGAPVPSVGNNPSRSQQFNKAMIENTGFIYSVEFKQNASKYIYYRNGSSESYIAGKQAWIKAPATKWIWCDEFTLFDSTVERICTNGTTIRIAPPVGDLYDADGNEIPKNILINAIGYGFMEISGNNTKIYYRNGTIALFNQLGFVSYVVPPTSIFVQRIVLNPADDGTRTELFSNGTTRIIAPAVTFETDPQEKAIGYLFMDMYENGTYTVFYRNGTVALFNQTDFIRHIKAPTSYYVSYEKMVYEDTSYELIYSNGTTRFFSRPVDKTDVLAYKQLSFIWFQRESDGNLTVYYRNGTVAFFNTTGFVNYIVAPEVIFTPLLNGGYSYLTIKTKFEVIYNRPIELELTLREKSVTYLYQEIYSNGTNRTVYRNGTIAIFSALGQFEKFEVQPTSIYEEILTETLVDGSIQMTYENGTIRRILPKPDSSSTRLENSTGISSIDTFANGTQRRHFRNGTVAIYVKGTFMRFEVQPTSIYIDYPVNEFDDGSFEVFYFNGTRRFYAPPLTSVNTAKENTTGLWYTDCYPNADCLFVYRNGSSAIYTDGSLTKVAPPPAKNTTSGSLIIPPVTPEKPTPTPLFPVSPTPPSTYEYVNKTGPKRQTYDKDQGGAKKYKEEYQSSDARATKSAPSEPLCKGRNQMIIMGDSRISASVYLSRLRTLAVVESDTPATLKLQVESVNFLPDSGFLLKATFTCGLGLALAFLAALF